MKLLYDPQDPQYHDAAEARAERDRTFQICTDCRLCVKYCFSFKSLFQLVDDLHEDKVDELTGAEHERIVDECFQCKLCYTNCPYTPDQGQEWVIDFPGLMTRSLIIQHDEGKVGVNAKLLARTDLQGKVATTFSPIVNKVTTMGPLRGLMEKSTGISKDRLLPSFAKVRFTKWFRKHAANRAGRVASRGAVAVFPTCLVEYQNPDIGRATVGVLEHNGIECELPEGQVCCGMPWLDAGDDKRFRQHAEKNVAALAPAVRAGKDVVVPQPTCAFTIKEEYPSFLGTDDARLVAEHTFDAAEYLVARHLEEPIDTDFSGRTYESILWQQACHYQAQHMGPRSMEMMRLTGAKVEMVNRCSAIDGTWGLRAENVDMAKRIAKPLMDKVRSSNAELVAGDCNLANNAIYEETDVRPVHPMQVMARAYGLDPDEE